MWSERKTESHKLHEVCDFYRRMEEAKEKKKMCRILKHYVRYKLKKMVEEDTDQDHEATSGDTEGGHNNIWCSVKTSSFFLKSWQSLGCS